MDGVLIDSEPLWREAEKNVFSTYGIHLTDDMCRSTAGLRIDEVTRLWLNRFDKDVNFEKELSARIVENLVTLVKKRGNPMPGAVDSVQFFKQNGWKIGLASSSWMQIIEAVIERLELQSVFEAVFSAEGLPYGKPHPEVYLKAAAAMQVGPVNCLVIEDSFHGALAGLAARMKVIAVPEAENRMDKRFHACHLLINSLEEIPSRYPHISALWE